MGEATTFFNVIKDKIDLEKYLEEELNVELIPAGAGRLTALCPFHNEDTPSFVVEESDQGWKKWHCFGACDKGGTIIDAVMEEQGFELAMEAAMYLNDLYELGLDINDQKYKDYARQMAKTEADIERTKNAIQSDNKLAQAAKQYLYNRGMNDETIQHFQLGVDIENYKTGRIAIPIIDKSKHPVALTNRALFDQTKCRACGEEVKSKDIYKQFFKAKRDKNKGGDGKWKYCPNCNADDSQAKVAWLLEQYPKYKHEGDFGKSEVLYNEYIARYELHKNQSALGLFLSEGFGEVWAGFQAGHKSICSYNGAVLSDWQANEAISLVTPPKSKKDTENSGKPIILIPDFDETGLKNIEKNIRKIRVFSEDVEIQVIYGIEQLTYKNSSGEDIPCKDLGDVLQHFGDEKVSEILTNNRWSATEYLIRKVISKKNPKTGESFYSKQKQQRMVSEILSQERSKATLDGLVDVIAEAWNSPEETIRSWFYSDLSADNTTSYQHLFRTIEQSQHEAQEFLRDTNVIPFGFKDIDKCLPGEGARLGQLVMIIGKSGTGKTMLSSQILANMADNGGVNSIFFTLEQPPKSLFARLACQALNISMEDAEALIVSDDPEDKKKLEPVFELYSHTCFIDNVPEQNKESITMTPSRVQAIIQDANLNYFEGKPANVVLIDHIGFLTPDDDAPEDVRRSDTMAPGYVMHRLFEVCKATNVLMIILQQLPKEVKRGVPVAADAGRGGSRQTDSCDLILTIWRPEQNDELDEKERADVEGQYKLALAKNRHGRETVANLMFDKTSLQILPASKIQMPDNESQEAVIDLGEDENMPDEFIDKKGEDFPSASELDKIDKIKNSEPDDNMAYLQALGVEDDPDDEFGSDPELASYFED